MNKVVSGLLAESYSLFKKGDIEASVEYLREALDYTEHEEVYTARAIAAALRAGKNAEDVSGYFHLIFAADTSKRYEIYLKGKIDLEGEDLPEENTLDDYVADKIKEELKWKPKKGDLDIKIEGKDTVSVYMSFDNSDALQNVAGYIGKNDGFDSNWFSIISKGGDSGIIINSIDEYIKAVGIPLDMWVTFFTLYNKDLTNKKLKLSDTGTYLDLDSYKNTIYSRDKDKNTTTTYTADMLNLRLPPPLKLDAVRKSESKKLLTLEEENPTEEEEG